MKDYTILISNRNSYEAIQLCIESILRYTEYPNITVYDDSSTNIIDREYLHEARDQHQIELIEGNKLDYYKDFDKFRTNHYAVFWHGRSLNILIASCITRYAVILDCDIQILNPGWIKALIDPMLKNPKVLGVCDLWEKRQYQKYYVLPVYKFSFGALDMKRYHDGMAVDWIPHTMDRRKEPMLSLFADLYPPIKSHSTIDFSKFDENLVRGDPGSPLWLKLQYDNPKKYEIVSLDISACHEMFRHYEHISIHGDDFFHNRDEKIRLKNDKFIMIQKELDRLRQKKEEKL